MKLKIQDTFNAELPADPILDNTRRQVSEACFSYVTPRMPSNPSLIHVSREVADEIGLSKADVESQEFLQLISGAKVLAGSSPYAMSYAGHQFGHWAGQLGDGRAINLMEVVHKDKRRVLQLKGAGSTPYSRTADGLAVLRSSIREHLCSEAMYHLDVPTTRSLSICLTGDQVLRDMLYNGNAAYEKGAVVCRVSPTFIRFGNFELFASRKDMVNLQKLADYTIKYFFPNIKGRTAESYLQFFASVVNRTLKMVVEWQRVGFVHGVMNTDNMSILGLTIDYGPYGWLEGYDTEWTPNTTDREHRRYRFGNQPAIAQWNLYQLANALYPLIGEAEPIEAILNSFQPTYADAHYERMRAKLGLRKKLSNDEALIDELENTLKITETDMTIFFRLLANGLKSETPSTFLHLISVAFYSPQDLEGTIKKTWLSWFAKYLERLSQESQSDDQRKTSMNTVNPKYVLRNYMAQLAIDAADNGDYSVLLELHTLLKNPYAEQDEHQRWFVKRPEWARNKVGCSMLSCSS